MKPENAMQLLANADLSECSLAAALHMIEEKITGGEKKTGIFRNESRENRERILYGELQVPSQELTEAYYLLNYSNCIRLGFKYIHLSVNINTTYNPYEWSVTVCEWHTDKDAPYTTTYTVWSPGA